MGQSNSSLRRPQRESSPPDRQRRFSLSSRPLATLRRLRRRSSSSSEQARSKRVRSDLNAESYEAGDPGAVPESSVTNAFPLNPTTNPNSLVGTPEENENQEHEISENGPAVVPPPSDSLPSVTSNSNNLHRSSTRSSVGSSSSEEVFFDADPAPEQLQQVSQNQEHENTPNNHPTPGEPPSSSIPGPSTGTNSDTFSGLNVEDERRLISQLSQTLFTAVMVIATHELSAAPSNTGTDQTAENNTVNEQSGTDTMSSDSMLNSRVSEPELPSTDTNSTDTNPTDTEMIEESLRQAMASRIWRQLLPQLDGSSSRSSNPLRSRSDSAQLDDVRGLDGEPFLTFMDNLWDGSLDADIAQALSGSRQAFSRIFRFPRDEENRYPVIVLRVSAAASPTPVDPPAAPEQTENSRDESNGTAESADANSLPASVEEDQPNQGRSDGSTLPFLGQLMLHAMEGELERVQEQERAQAEQHARAAAPNGPNSGEGRAWITYVVRGSFNADHPIFLSPGLRTNNPTAEDLQMLDQLYTPKTLRTATQNDIDRAGGEFTVSRFSELKHERCPVCLIDYEEDDECRQLNCTHIFHKECVDGWLTKSHNSCPMCRHEGVPVR